MDGTQAPGMSDDRGALWLLPQNKRWGGTMRLFNLTEEHFFSSKPQNLSFLSQILPLIHYLSKHMLRVLLLQCKGQSKGRTQSTRAVRRSHSGVKRQYQCWFFYPLPFLFFLQQHLAIPPSTSVATLLSCTTSPPHLTDIPFVLVFIRMPGGAWPG